MEIKLCAGLSRMQIPAGQEIFLFSETSRPAMGLTKLVTLIGTEILDRG